MKVVEITDWPEGWQGKAKIQMPSYSERLVIMKSMQVNTDSHSEGLEAAIKMFDVLVKHCLEFSVQHGQYVFESLEDVGYYKEGQEVINHLTTLLMQGLHLGKSYPSV